MKHEMVTRVEDITFRYSHHREAVKELERNRIIIDVSHLNRAGFWELCEVAERPFVATHSNCFEICPARAIERR